MVVEGRVAAGTHELQVQLNAFKAETLELHKLWADMEQELASDNDSVAPSDAGEQGEARRQRRAERAASRAAKRKKLEDTFGKVVSKFS